MQVIRVQNPQAGGKKAFELMAEALAEGAKVFGLATGSTPLPLYENLRSSKLDFTQAISVNLDEYKGLAPDHPQSYHYFMQQNLFATKPFKHSFIPDGLKPAGEATAEYDAILQRFPIDFQILGLGQNGHIGFNEPGTPFSSTTHEVQLTASTIVANQRFFTVAEEVPKNAYSMGIASIMAAKKIVIMAYGTAKATAVAQMIEGSITEDVPASVLQRHNDVIVIVDNEAAANLKNH